MAMPDSDSDSDNALTRSIRDINTLFIDTNLDTHLAMIVSGTDTVSDLKSNCFGLPIYILRALGSFIGYHATLCFTGDCLRSALSVLLFVLCWFGRYLIDM